ncbi:UNVERIFIED_CONTAM: hypothetical protein FKN15_073487 [Acipenser sinensis]
MASNLWSEEQFSCPVCLEILKGPITTACGHSYCMGCIKNCWDQTDHTGVYSCPQCRETFTPRPVLRRNTMLAEVVEKFKKTGINPPPVQSYAGPSDVSCDVCTGRNFKAVKSCLTCLASYCETHIKPHYEAAALKRHKLVNATGNLEQKLCAEHQKDLEVFCRTDQTCICLLCADKKHKPHDTVSAETQRAGKQRSARKEIKESKKIFNELIRSIEKIRSEVTELIGANEKAAVNQAEGFMKKLEQEIAELRRRNTELKQLSETEDHIHFLQNFKSLCAPLEAGDLPSTIANSDISFGAARKAVSELKDHMEDFCKGELVKISGSMQLASRERVPGGAEPDREGTGERAPPPGQDWKLTLDAQVHRKALELQQRKASELKREREAGQKLERRVAVDVLASDWFTPDKQTAHTRAYLLEGLLPTLLPGLEKLLTEAGNRQLLEERAPGGQAGAEQEFNPINYLAQHLMRNHPKICPADPSHPYTRGLRQVLQQLKEEQVDLEDNRLVQLKLQVRETREERVRAERVRSQVGEMRKEALRAQFTEWSLEPDQTLQLRLVQNALRAFLEISSPDLSPESTDSCQLTLDPNTANKHLWLSEGNRKVTCKEETQSYPDHPDRFDYWEEVLCREGLSGTRCYWEIEYSLKGTCIGVTYKGISTKARDGSCGLGNNDKSWGLYCFGSNYTA